MKKLLSLTFIAVALSGIGVIIVCNNQYAKADNSSYTCLSDGTFASATSGVAALTHNDLSQVTSANSWLASMMQPDVAVTTSSTITPSQTYATNYTGPTSGTFNLQGASYSTVNSASIVVTSPSTIPDSYRGVISGHVTMTPTTNRWIIQAYKDNSGTITQVPVQALADGTTGDFSIDLTNVAQSYTGEWMLGILDANSSYAPYGVDWPSPSTYAGLEVQEYVITDKAYYWATASANADGTFSFTNSNTGTKMFRLVDTSSGNILAESNVQTGLIRSYEYQPSDPAYGTALQDETYVYDQATALYAAISQNESSQAKLLVTGLLAMQSTTGSHVGGFVFQAPQLSPTYTDNYYRTGADAIALDALLNYIKAYPNDPQVATYTTAALSGLDFLQSTLSTSGATSGLYLGGYGQYSGNPQTFDSSYVVPWVSTEHNLDVWHALTDASQVLGDSTTNYAQMAATLSSNMTSKLYNVPLGRYNQGINGGVPDTGDALDINTWGAIQLYATNQTTQAQAALLHITAFANDIGGNSGYAPFYDSADYPGALPNVWYEGSFGAALAQFDTGNYMSYRTLLNELEPAQQNDGSFKYAVVNDNTYSISNDEAVASTAWFILATVGRGAIWNSCSYDPPSTTSTSTSSASTTSTTKSSTLSSSTQPNDTSSSIDQNNLTNNTSPEITPSTSNATTSNKTTNNQDPSKSTNTNTTWKIVGMSAGGIVIVGGGVWIGLATRRRNK